MDIHYNNFNLLRILSALQVLLVHQFNSFEVNMGYFNFVKLFPGVPIFFFISGYLVAQSYERSMQSGGIVNYATKRLLRIFPALWVAIIFGVALAMAIGYLKANILLSASFWSWIFTQASILQFYNPEFFRGYGVGVINGVLWTITVELQLYALMPFFAFVIRKTKVLLAFLIAISIVAHILSQQFFPQENIFNKLLQVSALPWLYIFILGALCHYSLKLRERLLNVPVFLAFIGFLASMFFIGSVEVNSSNSINPLAVIFLMILVFHFAHSQLIRNTINFKFIRSHDLSYGIYIFHMPIINALLFYRMSFELSFVFLVISVFLMSILSWFFIERPCLSQKEALSNWFAGR